MALIYTCFIFYVIIPIHSTLRRLWDQREEEHKFFYETSIDKHVVFDFIFMLFHYLIIPIHSTLRRLWDQREEERELMKDVPGWVVGTWYGEKVYYEPAGRMPPVNTHDLFIHCDPKDYRDRLAKTPFSLRY